MDDFDKYCEEESSKIINNFDPEIIKESQDGEFYSVLVKDRNSDFQAWLDVCGENVEWNKFIFHMVESKDVIQKKVMDNDMVFDLCSCLAYNAAHKE